MSPLEKDSVASLETYEVVAVIATMGKDLERLNNLIRSVRKHSKQHNYYIVLVDNSQDGLSDGLEPVDEILSYGINFGWVGAIELVRRKYNFKYLWTIQDDMFLLNDVLGTLKAEMESNPRLGVCSPLALVDGIVPALSRGGVLDDKDSLVWSSIPKTPTRPELFENPANLCAVPSSGALWRASALEEAGGFNLNLYPVIGVDVDMCFRLARLGWSIKISNRAHIQHEGGGSTASLLQDTLGKINQKQIYENLREPKHIQLKISPDIDSQLIFEIATKASHLMTAIAEEGMRQIAEAESRGALRSKLLRWLKSRLFYRKLYSRYALLLVSPNRLIRKSAEFFGKISRKALGISQGKE